MMSESERKIWGIHTQDHELFLKHNVIAIGWKEIGDLLSLQPTRDAIKNRYLQVYPSEKKGSVATSAGMLYRFCYEAQIGDLIIYPSKIDRMINIGEITGAYEYVPDAHEYVNQRSVLCAACGQTRGRSFCLARVIEKLLLPRTPQFYFHIPL